jgi:hypothetical protein
VDLLRRLSRGEQAQEAVAERFSPLGVILTRLSPSGW